MLPAVLAALKSTLTESSVVVIGVAVGLDEADAAGAVGRRGGGGVTTAAVTATEQVRETPAAPADTVAVWLVAGEPARAVKEALAAPCGTVMEVGTGRAALLEAMATPKPPETRRGRQGHAAGGRPARGYRIRIAGDGGQGRLGLGGRGGLHLHRSRPRDAAVTG